MQIEVSEKEYCKLSVSYQEDKDIVNKKFDEFALKFKDRKVAGFRKGKADLNSIKVKFRKEINEQLKSELAYLAYARVLQEKNIKPIGHPQFTEVLLKNNNFQCKFDCLKRPDFELGTYKGFEIPKPNVSVDPTDLAEKTIEEIRQRFSDDLPFEENDTLQMGNHSTVSYSATCDGVDIPELNAQGQLLTVGSTPVENFDHSIVGMKLGETRKFEVTMPAEATRGFGGKVVEFTLTLTMATKKSVPALDDELAKKVGAETLTVLREQSVKMAHDRVKEMEEGLLFEQISNRLYDSHEFKIPEWLSVAEARANAQKDGINWEVATEEIRKESIVKAEKALKVIMILERISDEEPDAQMTSEEVINQIKGIISSRVENEEAQKNTFNKFAETGYLDVLSGQIRNQNTLKFILKNSTIVQ